jgi:hypothetical protein
MLDRLELGQRPVSTGIGGMTRRGRGGSKFPLTGDIFARAIAAPRLRIGLPLGLGLRTEVSAMGFVAAHVEQKSFRKWSKNRKLQRRQEKYAAMGPNCRNGHPWSENARFTYKGYRFCAACAREAAEKRRSDPTTYVGACPHGHAYTRENTMITSNNAKGVSR